MKRITELRAEKGKVLDAMKAISAKADEGDGRDLTAEEHAELERLKAEDDRLTKEITALEDVQRRLSASAQPVPASPKPPAQILPPRTAIANPADKGLRVVRVVRAIHAGSRNNHEAAQYIGDVLGDGELAEAMEAMATTPGSVGGVLVPETVSGDFVEYLRPASVVMSMGPRIIPMPSGNLTVNRQATGTSAAYVGERQPIATSGMTFGQAKLAARKLASLVPVSNDLLRFASPATDGMIRDDMRNDIAARTDLAFIRGDGTQDTPTGLRYQAALHSGSPTIVIAANATVNLANTRADLAKIELALRQTNRPPVRQGWLMSPRTESYLYNLTDTNANYVFKSEMDQGRFRGRPFKVTTQIPENLGGGTDESELYLVEFDDVMIGEATGLLLAASSEATYVVAGVTYSAFQRDETLFRAIIEHDIGMRRLTSVLVLTGVKWA